MKEHRNFGLRRKSRPLTPENLMDILDGTEGGKRAKETHKMLTGLNPPPEEETAKSTNTPEIVNTLESGIDQTHYAYALCECLPIPFSVRVPISEGVRRGFVRFRCPKCERELGVWYRGGD